MQERVRPGDSQHPCMTPGRQGRVLPVADGEATEQERPAPTPPERRLRIDIYHHFPEGFPSLAVAAAVDLTGTIAVTTPVPARPTATRALLIVTDTHGGHNMPGQITVDTTTEVASIVFTDDKGDTNAAAPSNASGAAVATFSSDTLSVATVDPTTGAVTPVGEGTATISVSLAYPDGSPVLEADGVTPFPVPAPVTVTVGPGAAVGDSLVLSV